jgi:membrane protease YdiL (CAAX protease family)
MVAERKYPIRFCPYCATEITSPTKYCVTCGAEITWSIKEIQAPPYPWSPKNTYLITIITYGFSLVLTFALLFYYLVFFGIPLLLIDTILIADPFFTFLLTLGEISFFLIPFAFVKRLKVGREKLGLFTGGVRNLSKDVLFGLGVGAAMVPIILVLDLYELLATGAGPPPIPPSPVDLFWMGMLCLSIILVIAPAEEVLFRGFIQNSLDAHYGRIGGLLVSSIIFGLAHLNPFIGVFHTIGGVFIGLLFQWRGRRLAGPIVAHATYDCLLVILDAFLI